MTADEALRRLLHNLDRRGYRFVTPTPATHARNLARNLPGVDVRCILGWNHEFRYEDDHDDLIALLRAADMLDEPGKGVFRSRVRVSTLDDLCFLHSAYPTDQTDAVFFGPDSYRFAAFLRAELPRLPPPRRIVDIGAGTGVGAIVASALAPGAQISMTDINPQALRFAKINAAFNGVRAEFVQTDALASVAGEIDCVIANPPYIADPAHRAYRDGGAEHGGALSLQWAREAAQRLERGGAFLLYTGSAIVGGKDTLKDAFLEALDGFDIGYREIDPDVFGEELEREDYADVERIAVVGLVAIKR